MRDLNIANRDVNIDNRHGDKSYKKEIAIALIAASGMIIAATLGAVITNSKSQERVPTKTETPYFSK